ncbi:rRNA maturation RNase YbeY [Gracilimonas sp.]|uniref:rRNA maturation RNase YbeY n=1 Tax=Gracilimonas sp. TaxID=1974203 RepID=UPI002870B8DF|nr:rRNA maturation RNase YbeY [Gracilimonas sp.]
MDTSSSILQIFNESDEEIPLTHSSAESILSSISKNENASFEMIELVYVDEEEIVRINKEHLGRDYITDIISFRYDGGQQKNDNTTIEGTLFCCAPRIIEQAIEFNESKEREFKRIFIHGLLHLVGYEDNTPDKKQHMTDLENKYLAMDKG